MNSDEQFTQLKRLLALKRHEQPPPGYFDRLPRQIIAGIEAERVPQGNWLVRFWSALKEKPAFGGALALGTCALIIGGVFLAGEMDETANQNGNIATASRTNLQTPLVAQLAETDNSSTNPIMTAQPPPFLFDYSLMRSSGLQQPVGLDVRPR